MVVHVVRGDGLSGVSAPQMGKVRELAASLGATLHTVVGDDVPTALLDFAREMNATQLVHRHLAAVAVGPHLRRGHRRDGRAAVRQDRRPHGHPRGGQARLLAGRAVSPRQRHVDVVAGRRRGAVGDLRADRAVARPVPRHRRRERAVLHRRARRRPARRRRARPRCRRCCPGLLLNYFLVEPRYTFTIAEPDSAITIVVLLAVAVAVAALVDGAGQSRPRGPAGVAGGRTARPVRRVGAARRRSGHTAGAGPGDVLAARREPAARYAATATARSSPASARIRAPTSTPPTPRSRSATTSSGC